jgi:hypothetical protein
MSIVCNCETGGFCQIHPQAQMKQALKKAEEAAPAPDPLAISSDDKLQLKTLEAEALDAQLTAQRVRDKVVEAQNALNQFAQTLFEKHGLDSKTHVLDLKGLRFVPRSEGQ